MEVWLKSIESYAYRSSTLAAPCIYLLVRKLNDVIKMMFRNTIFYSSANNQQYQYLEKLDKDRFKMD